MKTTPEAIRDLTTVVGGSAPPVTLNTIEALRQLYAALGGAEDVSKISTIPDMLEMITAARAAAVDYAAMIKGIAERNVETLVFPKGTESVADGYMVNGGSTNTFAKITTITDVVFPAGLVSVGSSAFKGCTSLENVNLENVNAIKFSAFEGCTSLKSANLKNIKTIGNDAFKGCAALENVFLPSTVESIQSSAFGSTSATLTIYCGFSEGAVSGAPWGATNATIVYDYTPT